MYGLFKNNFFFIMILLFSVFAQGGCGDGNDATVGGLNQTKTGNVAILLTDGFTDDFSEVYITITGIELISDDQKVQIFSGEKKVDLLKLRDESSLFSVSNEVPAIRYSKIRLTVKEITMTMRMTTVT